MTLRVPTFTEDELPKYEFTVPKYQRPVALPGEHPFSEIYQEFAAKVEVDDPYEAMLMVCTEQLNEKIKETEDFKASTINNTKCSDPTLTKILVFFAGHTVAERKKNLLYFLSENPALKTNNLTLLKQRVAIYFKFHEKLKERIDEMGPGLQQCIDAVRDEVYKLPEAPE